MLTPPSSAVKPCERRDVPSPRSIPFLRSQRVPKNRVPKGTEGQPFLFRPPFHPLPSLPTSTKKRVPNSFPSSFFIVLLPFHIECKFFECNFGTEEWSLSSIPPLLHARPLRCHPGPDVIPSLPRDLPPQVSFHPAAFASAASSLSSRAKSGFVAPGERAVGSFSANDVVRGARGGTPPA